MVCNNKHLFSSHVCGLAGGVLIQAGAAQLGDSEPCFSSSSRNLWSNLGMARAGWESRMGEPKTYPTRAFLASVESHLLLCSISQSKSHSTPKTKGAGKYPLPTTKPKIVT